MATLFRDEAKSLIEHWRKMRDIVRNYRNKEIPDAVALESLARKIEDDEPQRTLERAAARKSIPSQT